MKYFLFILGFVVLFVVGHYAYISVSSDKSTVKEISILETPKPFVMKGLGILGDSQSDEYRADDNRGYPFATTTLNWVEQLSQYRSVNLGGWGAYDEPRRTGYEYNWSRSGMTARELQASGQVEGLVSQIERNEVNVVVVYVGANDFAPYASDGYRAIYTDTLSADGLRAKQTAIVDAIIDSIEWMRTTKFPDDLKIVFVTIPDWGLHYTVQQAFPDIQRRERVSQVITNTNAQIIAHLQGLGVSVLDINSFFNLLINYGDSQNLEIANTAINSRTNSNNPRSLFLNDGIHPGTVLNSQFANQLIIHLQQNYHITLNPFSEAEIIRNAGIR